MKAIALLLWRELRLGIPELGLPTLGLSLGMALIMILHTLQLSVLSGLAQEGRALLGGDLEFRLAYRPIGPSEASFLTDRGRLSEIMEMRAMARNANNELPLLVELKAVDSLYPLYGALELAPPLPQPFSLQDGLPGVIADPLVAERLHLKIGDIIKLGTQDFQLRAFIAHEPDRATRIFSLGPRLMITKADLDKTGLVQPGSLIYYTYRLAVAPNLAPSQIKTDALAQFPATGWRIRDIGEAGEGTRRFLDDLTGFFDLIGFAALLLGGLGIFSGISRYLEKRAASIAMLLFIGASRFHLLGFLLSILSVITIAAAGIALSLIIVVPAFILPLLSSFGLPAAAGFYGQPVLLGAGGGTLMALLFALPPFLQALKTKPVQLLRSAQIKLGIFTWRDYLPVLGIGALCLCWFFFFSEKRWLLLGFCLAVSSLTLLIQLLGRFLQKLASKAAQWIGHPVWRLAWHHFSRSAISTRRLLVILGVTMTLLVTLAQITGSLSRFIQANIPAQAPSFYFLDIPPDQGTAFDQMISHFPTARDLARVPMLRGKLSRINNVPSEQLTPPPDMAWVLRSDRGLTWSAEPPRGVTITAGQWWPKEYQGPPLISLDQDVAKAFGLKIGDHLTVNLLGREITGEIANLREIHWTQLEINFVMIFSPGVLEKAPQTDIATVRVDDDREGELMNEISARFPGISVVRVKDAINSAARILRAVSLAILLMGITALCCGFLVLMGAMALGQADRLYEAVIFKTIGAQRKDLALLYGLEFGISGLVCALLSLSLGSLCSYLFLHYVRESPWFFSFPMAGATIAISIGLSLVSGFAGRWQALGSPSAAYLRND